MYQEYDGSNKGDTSKVYRRGYKGFFLFDSWFASKKAAEAAMEICAELIGTMKTNTKGIYKEIIEKITNYWSGGSHLVLRSKPMIPGDRTLIAIG